ncbi:MAG: right-handed parallel beta-helix repeat-containing protein [Candidatus Eremiobacteraeota bacterium]|nr:right-handed parallel beta-helix repeat-containing protein [Candidatus Eremiobacteraeota bacterium]
MTDRIYTRRDLLFGAGAATLAGLTACDRTGSSFLAGTPTSLGSGTSPFSRLVAPNISVSNPTGHAIQKAIDSLAGTGGTVYLTAKSPYIVDKPIRIPYNNIKIIGMGASASALVAKPGAVLTFDGRSDEYVLVVHGATGVTLVGLLINTSNENNSNGARIGIGVLGATSVALNKVGFIKNLGPYGYNQGLGVYNSSHVNVLKCQVRQSRSGMYFQKTTNFSVRQCLIRNCANNSSDDGPNAAISLDRSSAGSIKTSFFRANENGGIVTSATSDVLVDSCKFQANLVGVAVNTGSNFTVQNSQFAGNRGVAIDMQGATGMTIAQNVINDNADVQGYGAIDIGGHSPSSGVQIVSNTIVRTTSNSSPGIAIGIIGPGGKNENGSILSNSVHGFGVGVDLGPRSDNFTVSDNDLRSNTTCYTNSGSGNTITNNLC